MFTQMPEYDAQRRARHCTEWPPGSSLILGGDFSGETIPLVTPGGTQEAIGLWRYHQCKKHGFLCLARGLLFLVSFPCL